MNINELSQSMGSPRGRKVLVGRLFGEPYMKEGVLHIKQTAFYSHNIYRPDPDYQACLVGMEPLRMQDVCSDLIRAIENSGIYNGLKFIVGLEDEQTPEQIMKKESERYEKYGCNVSTTFYDMVMHNPRNTAKIFLPDSKEVFNVQNYIVSGDRSSEDIRVVSMLEELNGTKTTDILEAYRMNIERACLTPFDKEYERMRKEREEEMHKKDLEWKAKMKKREELAEKRRIAKRKKPVTITAGEREDLYSNLEELKQEIVNQKEEFDKKLRKSYRPSCGQTLRVNILF